ncbi:MAG: hypothetical protein IPG96_11385 [Proteobacteria bacterium]|nr:hypothetical protein [Pseudomonadota bacterium]
MTLLETEGARAEERKILARQRDAWGEDVDPIAARGQDGRQPLLQPPEGCDELPRRAA